VPFVNGFPIVAEQLQTTLTTDASDQFINGRRISNLKNAVCASAAAVPVAFIQGIGYDTNGIMLIVDASAGLPAGTAFASGLPVSAGALCVDAINPAAFWRSGVPFAANGGVAQLVIA
jgi:hypothetical protein